MPSPPIADIHVAGSGTGDTCDRNTPDADV
jgi:hypothetical protein